MQFLIQVSFYDVCGHTEALLWHSGDIEHTSITTALPPIDRFVGQSASENTIKGHVTELHYQNTSCRSCAGVVHDRELEPLPESRKRERRLLWRLYVDQRLYANDEEQYNSTRRLEYLNQMRAQLERELQSSAEMMHGQVSEEIFRHLDKIQDAVESVVNRAEWFKTAKINLHVQLYDDVPLVERIHILSPGWDADLFAVVDPHTIEHDETYSICLNELRTVHGRVRRLPCGHVYHATCVRSWFEDMRSNTCPYCRHNYLIVEPPRTVFD